jgi:hypothetical protein
VKKVFRGALIVAVLLPLAVSESAVSVSVTVEASAPAPWPLGRVGVSSPVVFREATKALYLEGASGVPLSKLVRLTVFGAFRPGLSIEDAAARFGAPAGKRSEGSKDIAVYESPAARIEVTDELSGSGCVSYRRRTLYAYPRSSPGECGAKVADVFDVSVADRIAEKGAVEVGVAEAGNGDKVWVLVRDGCVEGFNWWAPASQREADGSPVHSGQD